MMSNVKLVESTLNGDIEESTDADFQLCYLSIYNETNQKRV